MKQQQGFNSNQLTALRDASVMDTTVNRVRRVVAAARFMQRVLAVGSGRLISPSSPDDPPDVQAESTTRHAARLLAEDCILVSLM